jgi:hypothetical protein
MSGGGGGIQTRDTKEHRSCPEAAVVVAEVVRAWTGRRRLDGMELDCVRRHAELPVLEVEEGDADHTGLRARTDLSGRVNP